MQQGNEFLKDQLNEIQDLEQNGLKILTSEPEKALAILLCTLEKLIKLNENKIKDYSLRYGLLSFRIGSCYLLTSDKKNTIVYFKKTFMVSLNQFLVCAKSS